MTVTEEQLELEFDQPRFLKDQVRTMAYMAGMHGITVAEIRQHLALHHGSASSALSGLEKEGHLVRLAERRERCHVYVVPGSVVGRAAATPRRRRVTPQEEAAEVADAFQRGRRNGRDDALVEVFRFAQQTRAAVLQGTNPVKRHDNNCYRQHPECALRAVMRFVNHKSEGATGAVPEAARSSD